MATDRLTRRRRRLAVLALSALVGGLFAVVNSGIVGGFPPKLRPHHLQIAAATAYVNVDLPSPTPPLADRRADPPEDIQTMIKRAELVGRLIVSQPVLSRIESRCHIAAGDLSGLGRITANVPSAVTEPDSERRASDIAASQTPYRLEVQGRPATPIVDIYAQAPAVAAADCVADAAAPAVTDYMRVLAQAKGISQDKVERVQPLGPARGGPVDGGATVTIAFLTFLTMFGLTFAALAGAGRLRRRRAQRLQEPPEPAPEPERETPGRRDSWPHTTRLLPWMLAGFIALLWLTPFNDISLNASLPIELRLDRLVLPFVVLVWLLAFVAGGRVAPRMRMTGIHVALGAVLACAFLSVVTDARYLNHSLELQLSLKKLPLMLSYVSVFVIAASAVRRSEVQAFLSYTLGLGVIVALGMIWEYRMKTNLFWHWSEQLLPGSFTIDGTADAVGLDNAGRRIIRGPAEVPLEAVAMLTMALPIAFVRIIHARTWRPRILYGLAVCALFAAALATYRKSALIAPVSVIVTLAWFRRRELLRLAPLGMVMLILISSISPGAIGSTVRQFTRSDATAVPTVSDRISDYDAIRPDVWSHLLLGRGWGSYNHASYRILDSEILTRTIEGGVIGLIAFLMLGATVVACSRRTIAARDPARAPVALIGASIAVAFLVLGTLFDELSFPHAVYIFLYLVGLETVVLRDDGRAEPAAEPAAVDDELEFADVDEFEDLLPQAPLVPAR
jgi:hypothetical protein